MAKEKNIMFMQRPSKEMKYFSDEEVLEEMKKAISLGWDIQENYEDENSFYNALHACAMNYHFQSMEWLLKKGLNPNLRSGNDNTAFTFLVSSINNSGIEIKEYIKFFETLKKYGGDLSLSGYEKKSPLELYDHFNGQLNDEITEYLVKHADFENTLLLNEVFTAKNLLTIKTLKVILKYHKIDLKKIKPPEKYNPNVETYWDSIAFSLSGRYSKERYEKITWLHNKIGFDLDSWHSYKDFDGKNNDKYHINLLGLAIQNKNNNMFQWVLKRKPEYVNDVFYKNDNPYTLLEFSLMCDFRKGVQLALRKMNQDELNLLDFPKLKTLCIEHSNHLTLETFQKTYTAIMYKNLMNKYENSNVKNTKTKKMKI